MVNALDWRKGFDLIQVVLTQAARRKSFDLFMVGQERLPMPEVEKLFTALEEAGIRVFWWRYADDDVLHTWYQNADLMLFPSLYEGLGLPVLEAQSAGMPVITSTTSSFPEINFNKQLCFDLRDTEVMANAVVLCMDQGHSSVKRGAESQAMVAQRFPASVPCFQRIMLNG